MMFYLIFVLKILLLLFIIIAAGSSLFQVANSQDPETAHALC